MSRLPTIFLSYNPNSDFEQTLAIRLHTIGAVHGFKMLLPDRYADDTPVSRETRSRIMQSDYFILFSTSGLDKVVLEEIRIANRHLNNTSKIIIIYDKHRGKNLKGIDNCTEVFIDTRTESPKEVLSRIITEIQKHDTPRTTKSKQASSSDLIGGLILAGLGLLFLGAVFEGDKNAK
jgi:hypothetical protein